MSSRAMVMVRSSLGLSLEGCHPPCGNRAAQSTGNLVQPDLNPATRQERHRRQNLGLHQANVGSGRCAVQEVYGIAPVEHIEEMSRAGRVTDNVRSRRRLL